MKGVNSMLFLCAKHGTELTTVTKKGTGEFGDAVKTTVVAPCPLCLKEEAEKSRQGQPVARLLPLLKRTVELIRDLKKGINPNSRPAWIVPHLEAGELLEKDIETMINEPLPINIGGRCITPVQLATIKELRMGTHPTGGPIAAIKWIRTEFSTDLKTAKGIFDAIEAM